MKPTKPPMRFAGRHATGEVVNQAKIADLGTAGVAEQAHEVDVAPGGKASDGVTVALEDGGEMGIVSGPADTIRPAVADGHPAAGTAVASYVKVVIVVVARVQGDAAVSLLAGPGAAIPVRVKGQVVHQLVAEAASEGAAAGVGGGAGTVLIAGAGQAVPHIIELLQGADIDEAVPVRINDRDSDGDIGGVIARHIGGGDSVGGLGNGGGRDASDAASGSGLRPGHRNSKPGRQVRAHRAVGQVAAATVGKLDVGCIGAGRVTEGNGTGREADGSGIGEAGSQRVDSDGDNGIAVARGVAGGNCVGGGHEADGIRGAGDPATSVVFGARDLKPVRQRRADRTGVQESAAIVGDVNDRLGPDNEGGRGGSQVGRRRRDRDDHDGPGAIARHIAGGDSVEAAGADDGRGAGDFATGGVARVEHRNSKPGRQVRGHHAVGQVAAAAVGELDVGFINIGCQVGDSGYIGEDGQQGIDGDGDIGGVIARGVGGSDSVGGAREVDGGRIAGDLASGSGRRPGHRNIKPGWQRWIDRATCGVRGQVAAAAVGEGDGGDLGSGNESNGSGIGEAGARRIDKDGDIGGVTARHIGGGDSVGGPAADCGRIAGDPATAVAVGERERQPGWQCRVHRAARQVAAATVGEGDGGIGADSEGGGSGIGEAGPRRIDKDGDGGHVAARRIGGGDSVGSCGSDGGRECQ